MSYCKEEGKDRIVFLTKEDYEQPIQSTNVKELQEDDDQEIPGLLLPNGDINWNCPCLGGMASGPCGVEFREAFSCFHYSEADPKGSDCIDNFRTMQECMVQYPDLYPVGESEVKEVSSADQEESPRQEVELLDENSSHKSDQNVSPPNNIDIRSSDMTGSSTS